MSRQSKQRVTIGMPVYNAASLISCALDSILSQTYSDFDLVISDNASTDETESICRDYSNRDSRIRYVRQEINRGSTWNFNEVFHQSSGEYFKWAAYDDVCAPMYLEQCVQVLDANPEVAWVHSLSRHIDLSGKLLLAENTPVISYVEKFPSRAATRPSERFQAVLLGRGGCLDSYGLIRSSLLRKTQLFLPHFGSEKVLMAELALMGRYCELPEPLFFARIHPAALGSQKTGKLQQRAINPLARGRQFPRLKLLIGYLNAVRKSSLPAREQVRCYESIARYLFQFHKWKTVVQNALTGRGLSGEYPCIAVSKATGNSAFPAAAK